MKDTITVCIPTCLNNINYLEDLLISISQQTLLPNKILIIVSNKRKTKVKLESEIKEISLKIPKNINPDFIISEKNGLSLARNIGTDLCSTDILIFGDDDDLWDKDRIFIIKKLILKNGSCLIRHRFKTLNGHKINKAPKRYNLIPNLFLVGTGNLVGGGSNIAGATCIFKSLKFNENMSSCEDWDFWIRCLLAQINIVDSTRELVTYRIHENRMSKNYWDTYSVEFLTRIKYLIKSSLLISGIIIGLIKSSLRFIIIDLFKKFLKFK